MHDDKIDVPEYMRAYERELDEWRKTRQTRMPMPKVPKVPPGDVVMMPMRDGTRLFTELFFPRDVPEVAPTILIRTPYPDALFPFSARPIQLFNQAGYVVAIQSCRGTWKSEGKFRFMQNEPEDGYDCIEWLAGQSWSNGKVGMYGSSYLGSVQWLAARLRPPHLTCIAPQSPAAMFFYEIPYLGGVLFKYHLLTWPQLVGRNSWDELEFEWSTWLTGKTDKESRLFEAFNRSPNLESVKEWFRTDQKLIDAMCEPLNHPTMDDWWSRIMLGPRSACEIDIPVFAITGFHDADQAGCLYNWNMIEDHEPSAGSRRHLLVGPWRHSQMATGQSATMGAVKFADNADVSLPKLVLQFFETYMRSDATARDGLPKRCRLYTSGSNAWHEVSSYPPKESRETLFYLSSGGHANSIFGDGRLRLETPDEEPTDQFPANWDLPVPPVGIGEDGRENETRYDVLVYTSAALDADLTVLGPVGAVLYVAADALDCDVVLRIEDVSCDGTAVNMTGELGYAAFRARYREGFDREVMLTPGTAVCLAFHVCHMGHVFKRGHCIRIALTATVANLLEPNHHTGEPVATAVVRRRARQTIYHDPRHPSCISLPIFTDPKENAR